MRNFLKISKFHHELKMSFDINPDSFFEKIFMKFLLVLFAIIIFSWFL